MKFNTIFLLLFTIIFWSLYFTNINNYAEHSLECAMINDDYTINNVMFNWKEKQDNVIYCCQYDLDINNNVVQSCNKI